MLNSDVTIFQAGLNLVKAKSGVRFGNGVIRNSTRVKQYLRDRETELDREVARDDINKLQGEINKERIEICEQYATKDSKGDPVLEKDAQGQMIYRVEDETKEEFEKTLKEKLEEKSEILASLKADRNKALGAWNVKEATLDVYMIPESYLPEDIKGNEIEGIIWMIEEMQGELDSSLKPTMVATTKKLPTGPKRPKS